MAAVPSESPAARIPIARVITRLNIGGPAIQALSLGPALDPRGFDTLLLHGRLGPSEGDMTALRPAGGGLLRHVPSLRRAVAPLDDLRALVDVYRAFRRFKPRIVHTHMAKAGTVGRLAGLLYNATAGRGRPARLVHTYHGHVWEGYFGSLSSRVFMAVERWIGRRTDVIVAISQQVRRDVVETFAIADGGRTHLVPLGFDLDRFFAIDDGARAAARAQLQIAAGDLVVSTVGRLTAIKQHAHFLDMAAVLAREFPALVFVIVGDGELREPLEQQAARGGLQGRVRFLGWRGDLDVIYAASDLFVLTSRNEGTPVALIEAMASGVASVSTDVGGVRDVLVDPAAGILVPYGDAPALANAVREMAQSTSRRREAGRAARRSVRERFSLDRLTDDLERLYRGLLV